MGQLYEAARRKIAVLLQAIYGQELSRHTLERFYQLIEEHIKEDVSCKLEKWNEQDVVLITYGDSVYAKHEKPLQTLHRFLTAFVNDTIPAVHILPFFPYSSDDGFSVIDYYSVDPGLGDWEDIHRLSKRYTLMADLVINHISRESEWFRNFLNGQSPGKDFFIEMQPNVDLSEVTRPRSSPLLTPVETEEGTRYVWTTFSSDQIDLDFSNPEVLYQMLKVLFFYIHQGIKIIRLDAIAYLWKKRGTNCIHLPETHAVVRLIRELAELIDPDTIILTETNVPHEENLSYFGNYKEAHMIYQFPLPPLLLHALHTANATHLSDWAKTIPETNGKGTYLNFTASHDGIGVRPLEGVLPEVEKGAMIEKMKEFGGLVNTRRNNDGSDTPYEINITYFDALKGTSDGTDNQQIERFLCSQTIMMTLKGIPAFYIHSLLATPNARDKVAETGENRAINRKKLPWEQVEHALKEQSTNTQKVFSEIMRLIDIRNKQKAFHPDSKQEVLDIHPKIFGLKRTAEQGEVIYCLSNLSNQEKSIDRNIIPTHGRVYDLIASKPIVHNDTLIFSPYQTMWLIYQL